MNYTSSYGIHKDEKQEVQLVPKVDSKQKKKGKMSHRNETKMRTSRRSAKEKQFRETRKRKSQLKCGSYANKGRAKRRMGDTRASLPPKKISNMYVYVVAYKRNVEFTEK